MTLKKKNQEFNRKKTLVLNLVSFIDFILISGRLESFGKISIQFNIDNLEKLLQ